jgi:hypothetical protein
MFQSVVSSLRYAFQRELLLLYLFVLLGMKSTELASTAPVFHPLGSLLTSVIPVLGFAIVIGGFVGILHFVLTDIT